MPSRPLISIVMPSLNQARFIETGIRSVLKQQYPHVDLIVVDGGSTDGTLDILQANAGRLRYVSRKDGGQGEAVNTGLSMARGEVIGWLNSDDFYFDPGVFDHVADLFFQNSSVDLVYGGLVYVDSAGEPLHVRVPPRHRLEKLKRVAYVVNSNAFFRRRVAELNRIDPTFEYVIDHEYFLRVARNHRFLRTQRLLACVRVHPLAKTATLPNSHKNAERRRRDIENGITPGPSSLVHDLYFRAGFKLEQWIGEMRYRSLWRGSRPYDVFLRRFSSDAPEAE